MKKRKKKIIKYSKNRVILSDTLPYEIPLTFSNRHLYNFINKYQIEFVRKSDDNKSFITWHNKYKNGIIGEVVKLLFGLSNPHLANSIKFSESLDFKNIPFNFKIAHKVNDFRELSIPHPKAQLQIIAFYDEFKELILYYSNQSLFSIRKPDSVAKFVYINDNLHFNNRGDEDDPIEETGREYESLKTFFTYSKYPNIYKFYEDYRYHRAEKKYNKLFKFDISRCFDSIYSHSITWATLSRDYAKDNINNTTNDFGNVFDKIIQNANYGETNGILIGPEFSRVFSEIILQSIDKTVEISLRNFKDEQDRIIFKRDYEIFRYVDDYFVFYNDEKIKERILLEYKNLLRSFKMSVSDVKSSTYEKPIITELTIAKDKISELINSSIVFNVTENDDEKNKQKKIELNCNSKYLITKYKTIIKESEVEYKDVLNFTFFLINKKLKKSISDFEKYYDDLSKLYFEQSLNPTLQIFSAEQLKSKLNQESRFNWFLMELLDFVFFIYTVNPRITFTIKLCQILSRILVSYKGKLRFFTGSKIIMGDKTSHALSDPIYRFKAESREMLNKKISDEIILILEKFKIYQNVQIETLYLLLIISELGKDFRLTKEQIIKYFKISTVNSKLTFDYPINYFIITILLYYIRDIKDFVDIKYAIEDAVLKLIKSEKRCFKRSSNTQLVLILFDLLVCPYLKPKFKRELLRLFGINKCELQEKFLQFKSTQRYWFTKWDNFNFTKEIEAKIANEPAY